MSLRRLLPTLLSVGLLLVGWQMIALTVNLPELIPPLPRLLQALVALLGTTSFYQAIATTIGRGLIGLLSSALCAGLTALLLARSHWMEQLFRPWLTLLRSVPVISFILLALIFLDPERLPLLIAFLTIYPLLTENLTKGLKALRPDLSRMTQQFHVSPYNRLTQLYYPQLHPFLFSGLISAAGFGWRAIIMGEALAQCTSGIGSAMKQAQNFLDVPALLAWTGVAIIVSFLTDKGLRRLARWQPAMRFVASSQPIVYAPLPALRLEQVSYRYAIHQFSYHFEAGKTYGISAPSGRGKTTLLQLISGALQPTEGTITPHPEAVSQLFEYPLLLPQLTAMENVMLPLASCFARPEAEAIAQEILAHLQLSEQAKQHPATLSYGQQQRVALARALAYPAPLLLLDEPFKGWDEALRKAVIPYLRGRNRADRSLVLLVSHEPTALAELADEVIPL